MAASQGKTTSIALLVAAEIAGMSLWFVSAAILPEMAWEGALGPVRQALLSSAVQGGFVVGALLSAGLGLADRLDPRRLFALAALAAAAANLALLAAPIGGALAVALRFLTGAALAGVYPVGMKIAVGWGTRDRGLLVGLLVGALTLGSAAPHLAAFFGGADWRATVVVISALAAGGGGLVLRVGLGPHHARAPRFQARAIALAWRDQRIRLAYGGYLGHMWELYAMWAWIGAATATSFAATLPAAEAGALAKLTAFLSIALGGLLCVPAGGLADRFGKAEVTIAAMALSGMGALATAASFGGPPWITVACVLFWGAFVVPDSAQFSALVADAAPPASAGSLLTFQTALGFGLTCLTVQAFPAVVQAIGWRAALAGLAIGPALGIWSMTRLRRGW